MKKFKILTNGKDRQAWIDLWQNWEGKEVFAHPDYIDLYTTDDSEALCAVMEGENAVVFYPFIKRSLENEPYCREQLYDITTAYGYGGMYVSGVFDGLLVTEFCDAFSAWAQENKVVCEFIRFALDSNTREKYTGEVLLNNQNIVVDLTLSEEDTWKNVKHKVRKNVNKAKSHNLEIIVDSEGTRIDDFLRIYYDTMKRRNAGQGYYFPKDFFLSIVEKLKGSFAFFYAVHENEIVSTELVLVSDENIYSFLGGTLEDYFSIRPNDLLKYEIINWGRENGIKKFILGGGYTPLDGIFQYKQTFAPEGIVPYYIGERIFMPQKYDELIANKLKIDESWEPDKSFFPLYRA